MKKSGLFIITALMLFVGLVVLIMSWNGGFAFFNYTIITTIIFMMILMIGIGFLIKIMMKQSGAMPRGEARARAKNHSDKVRNICEKCKQEIDPVFEYCPYCGATQKDTVTCHYCGHENPKTNTLCEKCNGFIDSY